MACIEIPLGAAPFDASPSTSPSLRSPVVGAGRCHELSESDRTLDSIDAGDYSSSDEEKEEEGVFFGSHTDAESRFLAKLSGTSPACSAASSPCTPKANRRQSRLVARLRKDSTEFHRRKTMIFPIPEAHDEGLDRSHARPPPSMDRSLQDRYQQEISVLQISPSAFASPTCQPSENCAFQPQLADTFAGLQIGHSPVEHDDSDSESIVTETSCAGQALGSDKENAAPHQQSQPDTEAEVVADELHIRRPHDLEIEEVHRGEFLPLDLGGLRRDDFEDVLDMEAMADIELGMAAFDLGADETSVDLETPVPGLLPERGPSISPLRHPITSDTESNPEPVCTTQDAVAGPSSPIPQADFLLHRDSSSSEGLSEVDGEDSDLEEMPIARAGFPVSTYPTFSPLRASNSPYRSTPIKTNGEPGLVLSPPAPEQEQTALQGVADHLVSPTRSPSGLTAGTPATMRTPRQLGPLPTTATPSRSRGNLVPLVDRNAKVLKSQALSDSTIRPAEPAIQAKDKSRALAVRGRLDAVFSTRPGMMGPPQRNFSGSSSQSSRSSSSRPASRAGAEPPAVRQPAMPQRPASAASRRPTASTLGQSVARPVAKAPTAPSTALPRPQKGFAKPAVPTARPALAPRSLVTNPPKPSATKPNPFKINRPASTEPKPAAVAVTDRLPVAPVAPVAVAVNPLKRPLPSVHGTQPARSALSVSVAPRLALGLPSRIVRDSGGQRSISQFHVGAPPQESSMARIAMRSPARQSGGQRGPGTPLRVAKLGTPSRGDGTPRAIQAKPSFQMMSTSIHAPSQGGSDILPPADSGPPASATRHASERSSSSPTILSTADPARGSSEDYEDVSMLLPQPSSSQHSASSPPETRSKSPSPKKVVPHSKEMQEPFGSKDQDKAESSRPKRETKPVSRGRSTTPAAPAAPWMTGKELKTTTDRNTMRNQVYLCAIDRQIVRVNGPRPPSPTSKIRTTADRDEEEKKQSREHRAKRRARDSDETTGGDTPARPLIERVERTRGPGEEEDWKTPARPAKKAKIRDDKSVKWDKELVIIRDDGSGLNPPNSNEGDEPRRSCMRTEAQVQLDKYGNMIATSRPKENLKRSKVVVTAVFYDGEEPVPVPDFPTADDEGTSSSGKGKKKK